MVASINYWTEREDRRIDALRSKGKTMREIALAIGRPYRSTQSRIHELLLSKSLNFLTTSEREKRTVPSRTRRTLKLQKRSHSFMAAMPNTKSMGYVIGVLYGDGFTNFKDIANGIPKTIGMTTTNESFRNAFAEALETWRGSSTVKRTRHLVKEVVAPQGTIYRNVVYFNALLHDRHLIVELLQLIGPTQTFDWSINLRDAKKRGNDFCDGIIQGLFDSDGSVSKDGSTISFGTASRKGAVSFCKLMNFRGYDLHCYTSVLPNRTRFYRINVRGVLGRFRYASEINSRIDYKAETLSNFIRRRNSIERHH